MTDMIIIDHLTKSFGSHVVLDDINLQINENQIFGLIGQNGAGKTTMMKLILGLIKPNQGRIYSDKSKVFLNQSHTIGYLPDVPVFYDFMNAREYLQLCAAITNTSSDSCDKLLELVGLKDVHTRISGYSRGMKQRLGIAQALVNEPEILICDEPCSALDPIGRKEILDILVSLKDKMTIIFSTHILSDVQRVCDSFVLLDQGQIVLQSTLSDLERMNDDHNILIHFYDDIDVQRFMSFYPLSTIKDKDVLLVDSADIFEVMKCLSENKIKIVSLKLAEPSLEDLFMEVYKND